MYFGTSQYPSLRDKPKKEQRAIVSAAVDAHAKWVNRRFWIAIATMLLAGWLYGGMWEEQLPLWHVVSVAVCLGTLFFCYLLFEINGPIYRAVHTHLRHET